MTYTSRFLPEVEDDAITAYMWYEEKSRGLRGFLEDVLCVCHRNTTKNEVIIFGLFHCARNPQTIRNKLQDRDRS